MITAAGPPIARLQVRTPRAYECRSARSSWLGQERHACTVDAPRGPTAGIGRERLGSAGGVSTRLAESGSVRLPWLAWWPGACCASGER